MIEIKRLLKVYLRVRHYYQTKSLIFDLVLVYRVSIRGFLFEKETTGKRQVAHLKKCTSGVYGASFPAVAMHSQQPSSTLHAALLYVIVRTLPLGLTGSVSTFASMN